MAKISLYEYHMMLLNDDISEQKILSFSRVAKGEGGFDWQLVPDPEKVEMTKDEERMESAMQVGNTLCRWRRSSRFLKRLKNGEDLPVLVSEGDSWFQFPLLISEVIDQLKDDYLIWSVGAAGDTVDNMVLGPKKKGKTEYMKALRAQKNRVSAFLFSGAGNDIIGQDPETGEPVLFGLLRDFNGDAQDVPGHINSDELAARMNHLKSAYETMIKTVRSDEVFRSLPIIIHGYDYPFPYPHGNTDTRDPIYAKNDEWLGVPFANRGIRDPALRRGIVKALIDELYRMLDSVAGNSTQTRVWLVNCRGSMPDLVDWNDEIHGTSDGFKAVARRFKDVLSQVIGS